MLGQVHPAPGPLDPAGPVLGDDPGLVRGVDGRELGAAGQRGLERGLAPGGSGTVR